MSTIFAAIGIGVLVLLAGNMPFNALRAWNLQAGTALPWAILPTALYLWAYWRFLGGRWKLFLGLIPRPIRNWAYRLVARNRYRWFGKVDQCALLTEDEKARLLE